MDNTPLSALEYVKNGQKILMEGLRFPFSTAKELNKHGILSEEELCAIRGLSGGADTTSKLLDMIIAKGEQACYALLQILHIPEGKVKVLLRVRSLPAPPHSPEEDFYQWVNCFTLKETQGPTETSLPRLIGNDLHLDVKEDEDKAVFEEAAAIMKQHPKKMRLYLHVDQGFQHLGEALRDMIFKCLPHISRIRLPSHINNFLLQLFLQAALDEVQTGQKTVMLLSKVIDFNTIFHEIAYHGKTSQRHTEFLLDLFSHIEVFETETGQSVQLLLNPVYQSAPAGWVIDLSERKASILLGVLELQTVKKPVKLVGWSDEETERKSFLQCLPYISQLGLAEWHFNSSKPIRFIANLFIQAAECDRETGEKKLQLLSSVCSYSSFPALDDKTLSLTKQSDFLLDLFSLLKDCENPSRQHVLQALQPVYQSAPAGWVIDLSERKASILLGVLELQTVKKTVKLVGWSETEIKSFLLCLPYISQLGLSDWHFYSEKAIRFIANLFIQAAECDRETGEKKLQLLSSVCSYSSFPVLDDRTLSLTEQSDFLLDLYSCLKDCENPPHKHVLQALQPVYQSALAGWLLDLSERKASILIEVLELQTVKKTVKLVGWSDKENEIKIFIQCLPYISQLGFPDWSFHPNKTTRFIANLFIQAAECDRKTGGKKLQLLSSVCSYSSFPALDDRTISLKKHSDFLLDLYSFLKDCETPTCKHVLQALQPIYQSVPAGWVIDLSERKASTFLGVLELQTVKKTVKLVGWSDEETQIKSFLQCLPYISKLGLDKWNFNSKEAIRFIANLFIQAADCDRETGGKKLQLLSSVCSYSSFPVLNVRPLSLTGKNDFLLDLYSYLKDYENPSRQHVLQALQPVYQAIPAGWVIDLSERKASILLGVLELQTVKKPVKLLGWSDEENEQRSLLQCLPYVSKLDVSKSLLQQLLSLISVGDEVQVARQAAPLSRVLGRKVDLSHIQIDPQTCMSLAAVLEQAEGLSELDLSHCQVNDHSVDLLLPHLQKARVLDLSNNEISDLGALRIHSVVSASSYIQTVRLFNNRITDKVTFLTDPRYDLWDQSKDQITEEFKPDLNHHNGELSYSFSCESGGQFQCSETGLVFLMKAPGRVEYSPAYWDEAALKTAGYEPAGPLFNIENPDRGLCSLRLPHCEADVEGREHLSVAHFCGGNMEVLKPLAVTETHVTIHVQNLSLYGLLRNIFSLITSSVRGQVLLFQPPGSPSQKHIYLFLLPSSVPVSQVKHYLKQHLKCRYITTTADCTFIVNQKYSVTSDPKGVHKIQPESWDFFCNYGPNFHPTFEVPFNHDITEMRLAILNDRQHEVWVCRISLTAEAAPDSNQAGDAEVCGAVGREVNPGEAGEKGGASGYMKNGKHLVDRHWGDLINKVGLVPPVLDYLLQSGFMELEMYSSIYNEKNPCDQMRSLMLKVIMPGGNRAKDELCRILETQQKCLMEELKGQ